MKFRDLRIATKLLIGFVIVAAIAGAVGGVGIYNLYSMDKKYTSLYQNYGTPLGNIAEASLDFQQIRVSLRDLLLEEDNAKQKEYVEKAETYHGEMTKSLSVFESSLQTAEGKEVFANLTAALDEYQPLQEQIIQLALDGQKEDATALLKKNSSAELVAEITTDIDKLFELKDEGGSSLSKQYSADSRKTIDLVVGIVVVAVLIAVFLGIILSRIISKPIVNMVGVAERVAQGDLDLEVEARGKDEIGILSEAIRKMVDNLNGVMASISTAAQQVSIGSSQLSDTSIVLSQGATEQASTIEELSASVEEISAQIKTNADNADKANSITGQTKLSAMDGNAQMQEMLRAMEDINNASMNISKIIKVIDDIAFQTNILALNAAVEAARAGQHGKGFAVVAEEVRNLAARSADAAKETTAMIEGAVKKSESGTKIANDTAAALKKIVEGIENVASLISSISVASNEQSIGIEQVNQGIIQVSTVIQTNSSTSEESAAASEELASQAVLLEDQVQKFKLKNQKNYDIRKEAASSDFRYGHNNSSKKIDGGHNPEKIKKIILSDEEFGKY
ncbi:methyl-accepting chemotaxis protein [Anaerocolumna xylanovorans]|uniref:Methyl-accepting chemotaxis sensory transducer n=1 Tax=Anaerocolumna xylanovorans DSM 12503 TaxID=1121345 RepID=A0A1M7YL10_9FIRM|nr:methyl-accepting chemotaxis protein [Anaerocolumna xylanovorans]SHO53276.1 methyl-accepting chemotaxis sensory transducer [Anaerocolumna xylanovorans DSM 12503]